jgi:glycerol-3-phosphate dehydrogenase (NAD(P)+)
MTQLVPVAVLGGGGFGRGLATAAAKNGRRVLLWSRSGRALDQEGVELTRELGDLAEAELIFVAVPSAHVSDLLSNLGRHLHGGHLLVHVSRGLVSGPRGELHTLSQLLRSETPCRRVGALAGPLVAEALLEGLPGGGVVGTRFPEVAASVREALEGPMLRIYETRDVLGVEVASAMVGLLTLVAGYVKGRHLGPAALAVLATRGIAEAARIGSTIGADERTFSGLAGVGDLIAAVSGDDRPEIRLGQALAKGAPLEDAAKGAGAHIEGLAIARQAGDYAGRLGMEAPISDTVAAVIEGRIGVDEALERLMARRSGAE